MRNISEIKPDEYGYGELEDKLIGLFRSGKPDFETADELLLQGADVNAEGKSDEDNILSEILGGYGIDWDGDCSDSECGEAMVEVIRYFLEHGFDVNKKDGRYGAQCLFELTLSSFDRHIIDATKLLLKAGAQNINITSNPEDNETPWGFIGMEGSAQNVIYNDHHMSNIFEAVYQIYQALSDGKDYSGIDSYEESVGRRVLKILSEKPEDSEPFFDMESPGPPHRNCFNQNLFFILDEGILRTTQYAEFWYDKVLPDVETVDVSERFPGVAGAVIRGFRFDHREIRKGTTGYGQPITSIEMNSGQILTFTINFGEVDEDHRAAYYYFGYPEKVKTKRNTFGGTDIGGENWDATKISHLPVYALGHKGGYENAVLQNRGRGSERGGAAGDCRGAGAKASGDDVTADALRGGRDSGLRGEPVRGAGDLRSLRTGVLR